MDPLPKEVPKWKQRLGSPAEAAKERLPLRKKPSRPTKPATLSQTMEKKEQNDELSVKTDHLEEVFNSAPASATGFNSELDSPERTIKNNPRRTSVLAADVAPPSPGRNSSRKVPSAPWECPEAEEVDGQYVEEKRERVSSTVTLGPPTSKAKSQVLGSLNQLPEKQMTRNRLSRRSRSNSLDLFKRNAPALEPTCSFQRVMLDQDVAKMSPETAEAMQQFLSILNLRDKYVYKKPKHYWGAYNKKKYRAFCKRANDKDKKIKQTGGRWRENVRHYANTAKRTGANPMTVPQTTSHKFRRARGVFRPRGDSSTTAFFRAPPSMEEFYKDYLHIVQTINKGPVRSLAYKRLRLLSTRFHLHQQLNLEKELSEQQRVPHRDFYNVRKVDTHVHHSSFMTQKHLLRFIKHKMRVHSDDVVLETKAKPDNGKSAKGKTAKGKKVQYNLAQVFESLKLTAYDLSVDTLDMHAHQTFERFDRFNKKYNPIGQSRLRTVFLKYDNFLRGRYLAEITKQVFDDFQSAKYTNTEPRVSIYGRAPGEWEKLSAWYYDHDLASDNVRWMIQIPRLYRMWKKLGMVHDFAEMLDNIFQPLFNVSTDPTSNPKLNAFLEQVVGFDCVDDESLLDSNMDPKQLAIPEAWDHKENPPYSYWMYYIYANLVVLNSFRASKGMSTFSLRPHAGEAGSVNHLAVAYLVAENINHGIQLRLSPPLQYMYYLKQIGLAMSPLSNNKLFIDYNKNPFQLFFKRGLNVSLSTDDPLQFHYTREPLVEEYCVASQVWKLSSCDMCEIARNSVLQSGFECPFKRHFLGEKYADYPHPDSNNIELSNVPNVRVHYRYEVLQGEYQFLQKGMVSAMDVERPHSPMFLSLKALQAKRGSSADLQTTMAPRSEPIVDKEDKRSSSDEEDAMLEEHSLTEADQSQDCRCRPPACHVQ